MMIVMVMLTILDAKMTMMMVMILVAVVMRKMVVMI